MPATQPSAEVTIGVSSSDTSEGTVDVSTLTFTPSTWDTPQTVTVTGVDDDDVDGDVLYSVILSPADSTDSDYDGIDPPDVEVTNTDNDSAPVDSTPPGEVSNPQATEGDQEVELSWSDPADTDLSHILVSWSPDGSVPVQVDAGVGSYTAGSLTNGQSYVFTVQTADTAGNVSQGVEITATPEAPEPAPAVLYVAPGATGSGTSWNDAADLQEAIDLAADYAPNQPEVWVKEGTYVPGDWPNGGSSSREMHFALRPGVAVYGGFEGNETDRASRDPDLHVTILSGDLNGDDTVSGAGETLELEGNTENVYHVLYHPSGTDLTQSTILDGFTITGGNADGTSPNDVGGGLYIVDGSPTLRRNTFERNYAEGGAGIQIMGSSSAVISDSRFEHNYAYDNGGGIHLFNYTSSEPVRVTRSTFVGNRVVSNYGGGGVNFRSGLAYVTFNHFEGNHGGQYGGGISAGNGLVANSSFVNNTSNARGGGLYVSDEAVEIVNSVFYGNSATRGGAIAMWRGSSNAKVVNVTAYGNSATYGGGMWFESAYSEISNTILWGNTVSTSGAGPEIYGEDYYNTNQITVTNTSIQDYPNSVVFETTDDATYTSVDATDPAFSGPTNPAGTDGIWLTTDDGLRLVGGQGNGAVDAGNQTLLIADKADLDDDGDTGEATPVDAVGASRVIGLEVDRGAYEQ